MNIGGDKRRILRRIKFNYFILAIAHIHSGNELPVIGSLVVWRKLTHNGFIAHP